MMAATAVFDHPFLFCAALFGGLMLCLEAGRQLGQWATKADEIAQPGQLDAAVYVLLGLLLAFAFSGAAERFDARRDLVVAEANAIGTASLRVDLLPADAQAPLRDAFRRYVDARVATYAQAEDDAAFQSRLAEAVVVQKEIWQRAVAAGRRPDALPAANMLLLPALNEMIDLSAERTFARLKHPPVAIYALLLVLTAAGAILAGYGAAGKPRHDWLRTISFAVAMTATLYLIVDLEFPRLGFIRVDDFETAVVKASREPAPLPPPAAMAAPKSSVE
jgi:hypothetical protein